MSGDTEQLPVHRVVLGPPRGLLGRCRGYCRCGWSIIGPRHSVQQRATAHERGRR